MDRLLGGSVFVSPLAQFSMTPDTEIADSLPLDDSRLQIWHQIAHYRVDVWC
jgi:hypothetical protein